MNSRMLSLSSFTRAASFFALLAVIGTSHPAIAQGSSNQVIVDSYTIVSPPFNDIAFPGNDISSTPVSGTQYPQTCADLCRSNAACVGWTVMQGIRDSLSCHIKSKMGAPVHNNTATSGTVVRNKSDNSSVTMAATSPQIKYTDPDMTNGLITGVASASACANSCRNQASCLAWTLIATNPAAGPAGACHLKASTMQIVSDICCISGIKTFTPVSGYGGLGSSAPVEAPKFVMGAAQPGIAFPGNDSLVGAQATKATDAISCRAACAAMDECKAYTFNPSNQGCHLKRAASSGVPAQGAISGSKQLKR